MINRKITFNAIEKTHFDTMVGYHAKCQKKKKKLASQHGVVMGKSVK